MRNGNNAKTIDQIHKEVEKEALEDQKDYQNINYSKRIPDDRRRISGMFGHVLVHDYYSICTVFKFSIYITMNIILILHLYAFNPTIFICVFM